MPTFGSALKLLKIPAVGLVPEKSGTAPASPVSGQLWTDTSVTPNLVKAWDATGWVTTMLYAGTGAANYTVGNDARLSDARTPIALSVVDASVSASAAIAESKLALATDAAAGTGSRRTLSLTAVTAAMPGGSTVNAIAAANAFTAALAMNNQKITGLGAPTVATDAARLQDVQNAQAGIDVKPSVRASSTVDGALGTAFQNGSVVDGVTLVTNDRLLIKGQTVQADNGLYTVNATGAPTRTADSIGPNTFVFVEEGSTLADTAWMVTNNGVVTVGTTALVFAQFAGGTTITGTANRITVTGTQVDIASTYVGQASITTLGTITSGIWTGTSIAIANGGTGATTAAAARTNLGAGQAGYRALLAALVAGTPLTVTHNLNTDNCIAQVRDAATGEYVYLDVIDAPATLNTLTVTAGVAYAASALDIVIVAV